MNDQNNRLELRLSPDNCTPELTKAIDHMVNAPSQSSRIPFIPPVAKPEEQPVPDKIFIPRHLRDYRPVVKAYDDADLEKVLKSGFNAKAYAYQTIYRKTNELDSKRARVSNLLARLENIHETLDVVHEGYAVLNQLLGFSHRAALVYGAFSTDLQFTVDEIGRKKAYYHAKRAETFTQIEKINHEARIAARQKQKSRY